MSYCTVADLINQKRDGEIELIQLTDTDNDGGIDYAIVDQAIARADSEINSYLLAYLPLAVIPDNLVYLACDITRYYLYGDQITDRVEALYLQAIAYLKGVASGRFPLIDLTSNTASIEFSSSPQLFHRDDF